jgi:hypothetical protein
VVVGVLDEELEELGDGAGLGDGRESLGLELGVSGEVVEHLGDVG